MHQRRFMISIGSLGLIWVVSITWLIVATPLVSTTFADISHISTPVLSGIQDTHEPKMSMGRLADSDILMKGINMAWYTNTQTAQFTLEDSSVVEEDITPYWFSIGFDWDILRADLDSLQKMGVRHVRITALIFQFLVWDDEYGSLGLNGSIMNTFDLFLAEVLNRRMVLTISFLGPFWTYTEHPSLMKYFRIFSENTGMNEWALHNLKLSIVEFAEYYKDHSEIHTWELVNGFSRFIACLTGTSTGFGLNVNATKIFDYVESVVEDIRVVDELHLVTVSDGWPPDFEEDWWTTGLVPFDYEGRLMNLTDYIALCHYSDDAIPNPVGQRIKYGGIVEIASTQLYNHSKRFNSDFLLNSYVEAINKSYSVFCPWEFSLDVVVHEELDVLPNHYRHDWTWDALLLYSLYRNDSLKFINTTNWYVLSTEPEFDHWGRMSFTLFHRPEGAYPAPYGFDDGHVYDPADGGTVVTVLSPNLLIGDTTIVNRHSISNEPLYSRDELGVCEYISTEATIDGIGHVMETGIGVESNHSWEAIIQRYDNILIQLRLNASGPVEMEVETGNFTLTTGFAYTVSYRNMITGATWEEILRPDENRTLRINLNTDSVIITITIGTNLLVMLSVGTSILVIAISIVLYYYIGRRARKE